MNNELIIPMIDIVLELSVKLEMCLSELNKSSN